MHTLKPYSASFLTVVGIFLAGIGIYFAFFRPPLLSEDPSYIGSSLQEIQHNIPGLSGWLQKVFWVMGGYIFTTGCMTVYIAQTSFRARVHGVFILVTIAGITSIGLMTIVNFILYSDFKWLLFAFTIPWIVSLILYQLNK